MPWRSAPRGNRLYRWPECRRGVSLAGRPIRSAARVGDRPRAPPRGGHCHARQQPGGARGQGRDHDDPDRLWRWNRPGPAWSRRQPQPAGRQRDRNQLFLADLTAKAARASARDGARAARIAVLVNPANAPAAEARSRDLPEAARALSLQIAVLRASTSREIEAAFRKPCA